MSKLQQLNGRYQLLERIGSGGMASVYKAQDLLLDRPVALKILHPGLTGDDSFLERFRREAHAVANLSHTNLVAVYDTGADGGNYYIVMEYVPGQDLKKLIRHQAEIGQALPLNRVLELMIQICAGIGYAHRAGLVHCDVKPHNILITRDERVKVTDFGIARAVSESSQEIKSAVWGTPQYLSPEQGAGKPATPAADVYAIGVILFELLTNRLPFQAESYAALVLKHVQEPPPSVTQFNQQLPAQLESILNKILAKDPNHRYRTAGQLEQILLAYRQQMPTYAHYGQPVPMIQPPPEEKTMLGSTTPIRQKPQPKEPQPPIRLSAPANAGTDWSIIGLGLAAILALIGLIPLWWLVYQVWAAVAGS